MRLVANPYNARAVAFAAGVALVASGVASWSRPWEISNKTVHVNQLLPDVIKVDRTNELELVAVTNTTNTDVELLDMLSDCSCVAPQLNPLVLNPAQSITLPVRIDHASLTAGQSPSIYLRYKSTGSAQSRVEKCLFELP